MSNYLIHRDHKYISREWRNGRWQYVYANAANSVKDSARGLGRSLKEKYNTARYYRARAKDQSALNAEYNRRHYKNDLGQKARTEKHSQKTHPSYGTFETKYDARNPMHSGRNGIKSRYLQKRRSDERYRLTKSYRRARQEYASMYPSRFPNVSKDETRVPENRRNKTDKWHREKRRRTVTFTNRPISRRENITRGNGSVRRTNTRVRSRRPQVDRSGYHWR